MDLAGIKNWIGGHKLAAGGIGAGALGGGYLLLRKTSPAKAAAGQPARLVVGRSSAARVTVALHQVESHRHKQPQRKHHK